MAPHRFNTMPSLAMIFVVKKPLEYTMLFGAVATGIMNAQLALIAAGIINSLGSI